jgi:hypothetical protein
MESGIDVVSWTAGRYGLTARRFQAVFNSDANPLSARFSRNEGLAAFFSAASPV